MRASYKVKDEFGGLLYKELLNRLIWTAFSEHFRSKFKVAKKTHSIYYIIKANIIINLSIESKNWKRSMQNLNVGSLIYAYLYRWRTERKQRRREERRSMRLRMQWCGLGFFSVLNKTFFFSIVRGKSLWEMSSRPNWEWMCELLLFAPFLLCLVLLN